MSVIFDQLRISDDGRRMFIDVHVNKADYFDNFTITSIGITTADHITESTVFTDLTESDYIYKKVFDEGVKEASLMLTPDEDFNENYKEHTMGRNLFFVWVECSGTYSECTPCFADEPTLGITFDAKLLYQQAMGYTKELADDCTISEGFIDFILTYSAFKSAVETDHYCDAKTFYNQLLGISKDTPKKIGRRCGCHG
jgi:hypothetical protein